MRDGDYYYLQFGGEGMGYHMETEMNKSSITRSGSRPCVVCSYVFPAGPVSARRPIRLIPASAVMEIVVANPIFVSSVMQAVFVY